MNQRKLCIYDQAGFRELRLEPEKRLAVIRRVGFDGFFCHWEDDTPIAAYARAAREEGLLFQSVHAPSAGVQVMWDEGAAGDRYLEKLMRCVRDCAEHQIPLAVLHTVDGFDEHTPNELGIARFDRLCSLADECGVRLAFENCEGEEYLARVLTELRCHRCCGFCWDSGHETCYNHKDMLALYGDLLLGTHLNDNMGQTGADLSAFDDAHMLPMDGIVDWQDAAKRLKKADYAGPLTFELKHDNHPGRHDKDGYAAWDYETFLQKAYERARRIAQML